MKIVFWGIEQRCETTLNLLAVASYIACHKGFRVTVLQPEPEGKRMCEYFSGKESEISSQSVAAQRFIKEKMDKFDC